MVVEEAKSSNKKSSSSTMARACPMMSFKCSLVSWLLDSRGGGFKGAMLTLAAFSKEKHSLLSKGLPLLELELELGLELVSALAWLAGPCCSGFMVTDSFD